MLSSFQKDVGAAIDWLSKLLGCQRIRGSSDGTPISNTPARTSSARCPIQWEEITNFQSLSAPTATAPLSLTKSILTGEIIVYCNICGKTATIPLSKWEGLPSRSRLPFLFSENGIDIGHNHTMNSQPDTQNCLNCHTSHPSRDFCVEGNQEVTISLPVPRWIEPSPSVLKWRLEQRMKTPENPTGYYWVTECLVNSPAWSCLLTSIPECEQAVTSGTGSTSSPSGQPKEHSGKSGNTQQS